MIGEVLFTEPVKQEDGAYKYLFLFGHDRNFNDNYLKLFLTADQILVELCSIESTPMPEILPIVLNSCLQLIGSIFLRQ
jgi:hypothetical protein